MTTTASDLLNSFQKILPQVLEWIDAYIHKHKDKAIPVGNLNFKRLDNYFSPEMLDQSNVVLVDRIVLPPLSKMGLSFFADFEQTPYSGITYKNTFFLAPDAHHKESTWFHEMVHIVQWDELQAETFLMAYAVGLLSEGYRDSPLEAMAYDFQVLFDKQEPIPDLETLIRHKSRSLAESAINIVF